MRAPEAAGLLGLLLRLGVDLRLALGDLAAGRGRGLARLALDLAGVLIHLALGVREAGLELGLDLRDGALELAGELGDRARHRLARRCARRWTSLLAIFDAVLAALCAAPEAADDAPDAAALAVAASVLPAALAALAAPETAFLVAWPPATIAFDAPFLSSVRTSPRGLLRLVLEDLGLLDHLAQLRGGLGQAAGRRAVELAHAGLSGLARLRDALLGRRDAGRDVLQRGGALAGDRALGAGRAAWPGRSCRR